MTFQTIINGNEVIEYAIRQFVALVENNKRITQKGDHRNGILQHIPKVGPIGRSAHLLGYFTYEIAFLHIFGAKDIKNVPVLLAIVDSSGSLSAPGIPYNPRDVLIHLRISHHKGYFFEGHAFVNLPTIETESDLRGNANKHIVRDIGIFTVHYGRYSGGTHTVQAFSRTVTGQVVVTVGTQCVTDSIFMLKA